MPLFNQNNPQPSVSPTLDPSHQWQQETINNTPTSPKSVSADNLIKGVFSNTSSTGPTATKTIDNQIGISQQLRFLDVKYKVYFLIVVSIIILVYNPIKNALSATRSQYQSLDAIDQTIEDTIDKQKQYEQLKTLFEMIDTNHDAIVTCINKQSDCDKIPDSLYPDQLDAVRAYLQLGSLDKAKMEVDESKILKNINEFLTQRNILSDQRNYNGTVTSITIWKSSMIEKYDHIMQVPVRLTITFKDKQDLLTFLTNLENYIFVDSSSSLQSSILYRIEEIKYDIVNYQDTQDVDIQLSAYAYKK